MASEENRDAVEIARALLGSISGQELPPQVVVPPPPAVVPQMQSAAVATQVEVPQPPANPQVPVATNPQVPPPVNPQAPSVAAPEEKHDPVAPDHAASASLGASSGAQSNPPVTIHRQLLLRLLRALPIASEGQLQAMLNVFVPNTTPPPAAPNPNPPQNTHRVPPVHPGGIPHGGVQPNDPLLHLLPQPTLKRSKSTNSQPTPPPPSPPNNSPVPRRICTCISLRCCLCPGHSHNARTRFRRFRKTSLGALKPSISNGLRHSILQ